jgi:hypothetical protein
MAFAILASQAAANQARPSADVICQKPVHVHGQTYGVEGHAVGCPFMRKWTLAFLESRDKPPHWKCFDGGLEGGDCHRTHVPPPKPFFEWYIFD